MAKRMFDGDFEVLQLLAALCGADLAIDVKPKYLLPADAALLGLICTTSNWLIRSSTQWLSRRHR